MGASAAWLAMRERPQVLLTADFLHQEYLVRGRSTLAIAREVGVTHKTVTKYLGLFGIPLRILPRARKQAPVDAEPFRTLATDWHAYWIGFLAADGGISRGVVVRLKLAGRDGAHVRAFQRGLGPTNRVRTVPNGGAVLVEVCSRPLTDALAYWGVVANKALHLEFPRHLPAQRMGAYLRGYFDGDGSVSIRQRQSVYSQWQELNCKFTCGSPNFLSDLAETLWGAGVATGPIYKERTSNAHVLRVLTERDNLQRFVHLLYDGATIALERKRQCFEAYLGTRWEECA